jgi:hypothetical protein
MAFTYTQNRKNLTVILHATANSECILVGNNTVSNVAISDEIVEAATIQQVWFGSSSGAAGGTIWTIDRDGTNIGSYDSTGWVDYAGNGAELDVAATAANVGVTVSGGNLTDAYIMLKVRKNIAVKDTY